MTLKTGSSIILSNNELIALPNSIFESVYAKDPSLKLDISGNRLSLLPVDLFALQRLLWCNLKFDNNSLIRLPDRIFTELGNFAEVMNFSHNQLTFLPAGMFRVLDHYLGEFDLQYNYLIRLPNKLFPFILFGFVYNAVNDLDNELIQKIFLHNETNSPFTQILLSEGLSDEDRGKVLDMSTIGLMIDSILTINLKHNNLTELPSSTFSSARFLNRLFVGHNYIRTLPERVFDTLRHLQILDLSYNKLETLPSGIFRSLKKLVILDLGHNDLIKLPENIFGTLHDLQSLKCNDNRLVINSTLFNFLFALNIFDISNNAIQQLPHDVFYRISNLLTINHDHLKIRWQVFLTMRLQILVS